MPHIQVINHEQAEGRLKEIYDDLLQSRGKVADVHMIQSLRPESIVKHMDLYMEIMYSRSELSRSIREMIAVVVSVSNKCLYCQTHHGAALNHYWKDEERLARFKTDFHQAGLTEKELALCSYAKQNTLQPGDAEHNDFTPPLKELGWSDAAILDATLVVAYFNFVNRIVLSLGVTLEADQGEGYKY